jgi:uncharacterized membrane protein YfcA
MFILLLISSLIVGISLGLLGAGGGSLIVPALVIYAGLTMQQAEAKRNGLT